MSEEAKQVREEKKRSRRLTFKVSFNFLMKDYWGNERWNDNNVKNEKNEIENHKEFIFI